MEGIEAMEGMKGITGDALYPFNPFYRFYPFHLFYRFRPLTSTRTAIDFFSMQRIIPHPRHRDAAKNIFASC